MHHYQKLLNVQVQVVCTCKCTGRVQIVIVNVPLAKSGFTLLTSFDLYSARIKIVRTRLYCLTHTYYSVEELATWLHTERTITFLLKNSLFEGERHIFSHFLFYPKMTMWHACSKFISCVWVGCDLKTAVSANR